MSELAFASPERVHLVWAVLALVALLVWLELRGGDALTRLVSSALQTRLVQRPAPWRRWARVACLGLGALCLVVGLMRPQWGQQFVPVRRAGAEIVIALDVSRSMLAEDVAPSRLERAKAEIADLLAYLDGDQVGLIAFAGRSTVLSPLTPDFSFLRLALDSAGPQDVARGGTRLEEPIRKAIDGFGPPGDAQRALLLITDGEDQDSFPRDAAEAAAEAGIRIIAVGFGDEAGSEISVTDPRTGARTLVRDADGRPVRTRLDGELLRDLASITGGAYVPAGTGVLDLESIYDEHIAKLTRGRLDARGRSVRNEAYQWPVLAGLVFLVASATIASGALPRLLASVLLVMSFTTPSGVRAQEEPEQDLLASVVESESEEAETPPAPPAPAEPEDPRELYNRGVQELAAGDADGASLTLARARREARDDGELRYAATYNLGWASVSRAEALEPENPREALSALHEAAEWFREAVSLRPEEEDPRHNLDVTLRRALALSDRLAQEQRGELAEELDALADRERSLLGELAAIVTALDTQEDPNAVDALRAQLAARATNQRMLLADTDELASRVGEERDGLAARAPEELTPEDNMRAAQLETVLAHLHPAREHMGQTRRQLRRRQPDRAFRRAVEALDDLKRARDQLRDPVAFLDVLLRDTEALARETNLLATRRLPGREEEIDIPSWLDAESLAERQLVVSERTAELHARLAAGLAGAEAQPPADPQAAQMLAAVQEAEPFVASASTMLGGAADSLAVSDLSAAADGQRAGLISLADARERFLDLRGLIEATHGPQRMIAGALVLAGAEEQAESRDEIAAGAADAQSRNRKRAERMAAKIIQQNAALAMPPPPGETGVDPETLAAEQERFQLAGEAAGLALGAMGDASAALEAGGKLAPATEAAALAVEHLVTLRRLFLSVAEQVREVAQRQLELSDVTQAAVGAVDDALEEAIAPLAPAQGDLGQRAHELAWELAEDSDRIAVSEQPEAADTADRMRRAGEHVLGAEDEMGSAHTALAPEALELATARGHQAVALAELQQALALLTPPEQQQQQENQQQPPQGQDGEPEPQEEEGQQQAGPPQDPAQLLQGVRDREAQRRREQAERERAGYETVERDW